MEFGPVIKNPVLDINKLVRQGTMLNQSVQNVEGDSTADQATVDLLARKDPVIQEISVGMSGEELTQYTVSGTPPISLPNSLGKPLKAWSVDLLPYQEGTGDPSPSNVRPIHGTDKLTITTAGKNLLPFDSVLSEGWTNTESGLTATYSNGYMRVTGTNESNNWVNIVNFRLTWAQNPIQCGYGTYAMPANLVLSSTADGVNANRSNPFSASRLCTVSGFYIAVQGGATVDWNIPMMFTFGTERPTEYTPYLAPSQTAHTLPQTVYTGTIGSEGGESRWGEVDLGTLSWGYSSAYNGFFSSAGIANIVADSYECMCEMYKNIALNSTAIQNNNYAININANGSGGANTGAATLKSIVVVNRDYDNAADFKTAMSGVKAYFPLATPTTIPLTAPTIPTPTGTATAWAMAENGTVESMEVTYVGKA